MYRFALALLALPLFAQPAQFHHVHLNSVNASAAIDFYTRHFSGERAKFGNTDALWTQKSWILFNKVSQPPPSEIVSSIYHIGWGAEDMKAEFQRLIQVGTTFQTLLTDAVDLFGSGTRDRNFFLYVEGPDHGMIEVQSQMHHNFSHIHLLSDDPIASASWYEKELGLTRRNPANANLRVHNGIPTGPSASLISGNVTFFWFPTSTARALFGNEWVNRKQFESPRGRVIDHFAFSVENLEETLKHLRADGVQVIQEPKRSMNGKLRSAFIQGPDRVEIELVEGHAVAP